MAKTNKTVGKTTTNPEKGVATMTISTALTKFLIGYNQYQEYRKNNEQTYSFASKDELASFAKTLRQEELNKLAQTYLYQMEMEKRFTDYKYREHRLNQAYGKEYTHPAELEQPDAQEKAKQDRKQQDIDMVKSAIEAVRKTNSKINLELLKELFEALAAENTQEGGDK
jgi:hypothetical protein